MRLTRPFTSTRQIQSCSILFVLVQLSTGVAHQTSSPRISVVSAFRDVETLTSSPRHPFLVGLISTTAYLRTDSEPPVERINFFSAERCTLPARATRAAPSSDDRMTAQHSSEMRAARYLLMNQSQPTESHDSEAPPDRKRVLFMPVQFSGSPNQHLRDLDAPALMDEAAVFFRNASFGRFALIATVTPALPLPKSRNWYQSHHDAVLTEAREAAMAAGYNTAEFELDMVYVGQEFGIDQALIGAKGVWLSSLDVGVVCHELGHNLGLHHANAWLTTDGSTIGVGANREYGHRFDTMGSGQLERYSFSAFEKRELGWLPSSSVRTITASGIYPLYPVDAPRLMPGQTDVLTVRKDESRDYWIEVRHRGPHEDLRKGVLLSWSPWEESHSGIQLLDCAPDDSTAVTLRFGRVFFDMERGIRIAPVQPASPDSDFVNVSVTDVVFRTVELPQASWVQVTPTSDEQLAHDVTENPFQPTTSSTATFEIEVPHPGFYVVWGQLRGDVRNAYPVVINLQHASEAPEQGFWSALMQPELWELLWQPADTSTQEVRSTLYLASGRHTFRAQIRTAQAVSLRLLITNATDSRLPPIISDLDDQMVRTGSTLDVPFYLAAAGQDAASFHVSAQSSDPELLHDTGLLLTGSGSDRTLRISPHPFRTGSSEVTLSAVDSAGQLARRRFSVRVVGTVQAMIDQAAPGDTVRIPPGIYYENLVIAKDLILVPGGTSAPVIHGQNAGPALIVSSNVTVALRNLTLTESRGAGIRNFGTLNLLACTIRQNSGPGLVNRGTLVVAQSTIEDNDASGWAGGLDNFGHATLQACSIRRNRADSAAGGLCNRAGATLILEDCAITENRAFHENGGGVRNLGTLFVGNTTLCNNLATDHAGAEPGRNRVTGGGIFNRGQLDLISSTLCRNQSDWEGGGLDNRGHAQLANCLVALNASLQTGAMDCYGQITSLGHNLIQDPTGCVLTGDLSANILGREALLGPLALQGGPTETVSLLPGSPALDAGDCIGSPPHDQRGLPRSSGLSCDIGAFEVQVSPFIARLQQSKMLLLQADQASANGYRLQTSTDLVHWSDWTDYSAATDSPLEIVDDISRLPCCFYRMVPVQ